MSTHVTAAATQLEEEPEPIRVLERLLPGFTPHSDDPEVLIRYLHGDQVNTDDGYVSDEIMLVLDLRTWGLGIEVERLDTSSWHKPGAWLGITLSIGPWQLIASRQWGTL